MPDSIQTSKVRFALNGHYGWRIPRLFIVKVKKRFMTIEVTALYIYPIKSCAGVALSRASLKASGFEYDRNWVVVDHHDRFVTQRSLPKMASITVNLNESDLILSHPSQQALKVSLKRDASAQACEVTVWRDLCSATDEGDEAAEWLTTVLGRYHGEPLRLKRIANDAWRAVRDETTQEQIGKTAFSDQYPYLVANQASLSVLNQQLVQQNCSVVPMNRFRPNIVLQGLAAFGENDIESVCCVEQDYSLIMSKYCERCSVITVDQASGTRGQSRGEPLRTLANMQVHPNKRGAFFGQNAVLGKGDGNWITVGDIVVI